MKTTLGEAPKSHHNYDRGKSHNTSIIKSTLFWYHGDEMTPPPRDLAVRYANDIPFRTGMPGPSLSWSAFGSSPENAIAYLRVGDVSPMILERLDESLVVLAHHLGWSLADVVVIKPRKALSQHPGADKWPQEAITTMRSALQQTGEYAFYNAANERLSAKIAELKSNSVDVDAEVSLLKRVRARATKVCTMCTMCTKHVCFAHFFFSIQMYNDIKCYAMLCFAILCLGLL
jgi:hypothetical protein